MIKALDWVHETRTIGDQGISETRTAADDERVELARMLDIVSCHLLKLSYRIEPLTRARFRLSGSLEADVTQACIVTLEPVPATISERFEIELRPEGDDMGASDDEQEILSSPDIEIIEGGRIDVGSIAYEVLSAALDPYPRKEGAVFDWVDPKAAADPADAGPFAALVKLKPER